MYSVFAFISKKLYIYIYIYIYIDVRVCEYAIHCIHVYRLPNNLNCLAPQMPVRLV